MSDNNNKKFETLIQQENYPLALKELMSFPSPLAQRECNSILQKLKKFDDLFIDAWSRNLKVAFLASYTSQYLENFTKVYLAREGFSSTFYHGPFGQIAQELLNPESSLKQFKPDLLIIAIESEKIFPGLFDFPFQGERKEWLNQCSESLNQLIDHICSFQQHSDAEILVLNFTPPEFRQLGLTESQLEVNLIEIIVELNRTLRENCSRLTSCHVLDLFQLQFHHGKKDWADPKYSYLAKIPLSMTHHAVVAEEIGLHAKATFGKPKKCLVLDMDNTLWGGVIGEDGMEGIQLGGDYPGNAFCDFQKSILQAYRRGVILCLCSKNNEEDALDVLRTHPDMVLKEEHIAAMRINWQDKAKNIAELAEELNIGTESMVFIDDSSHERNLVRQMCPEVFVPEWPNDPCLYKKTFQSLRLFESLTLTDTDMNRGQSYVTARHRKEFKKNTNSLEDYYTSLEMTIEISRASKKDLPRLYQLSQRTNQFNLTTKRYTESQLKSMLEDKNLDCITLRVKDRFEDSGLVGFATLIYDNTHVAIENFLMSCRIMGRSIEQGFMISLLKALKRSGMTSSSAEYKASKKNAVVSDYYATVGFKKSTPGKWQLDLKEWQCKEPEWLNIKEEI